MSYHGNKSDGKLVTPREKPDHERYDMRAVYWLLVLVVVVWLLLFLPILTAGTLGQFQLGIVNQRDCPINSQCHDFTLSIPEYPFPIKGQLAVHNPSGAVRVTDLFASGAYGQAWWASPNSQSFINNLVAHGHRVVQFRWYPPWQQSTLEQSAGEIRMAARPATVIDWVKRNYPAPEFNVTGSSGGSMALAYSLANYPIKGLTRAVVISGPPLMSITAGCENVPGYAFSDYAKTWNDMAFGYSTNGPCLRGDRNWETRWNANSVESGNKYQYPGTFVTVIIGRSDAAFIKNRGHDYYDLLLRNGQQALAFYEITGMGHHIQNSTDGLDRLFTVLTQ